MVRRIISGSNNLSAHVGSGESLLTVERATAPNVFEAQDAVQAATGQTPLNITCAVIDEAGNVASLVKADPAIDSLPAMILVAAPDEITPGCTYDDKTAAFMIPEKTIAAHTDRHGKPVAEQIVAAKTVEAIDVAAAISAAQVDVAVVNP